MKTFLLGFILLGLTIFGLSGCGGEANKNNSYLNNKAPNSNNTNNAAAAKTPSSTDNDFFTKAAQAGIAEVELGKLAVQKTQNKEVKIFAQKMIDDHTKAAGELKDLAAKKGVTLPTEMDSSHTSTLEKLKGLSGADFDSAYVDAMVDDHETAVDLFEDESEDGADADTKAFAAKTLPTLKLHLEMINSIRTRVK